MNTDSILSKIYYNPRTGFVSADKLYARVKDDGITKEQVEKWLKTQYVAQVQKPVQIKAVHGIPFMAEKPNQYVQADLMFYDKYGQQNKGYKYILNLVDIYSRKAFSYPLKQKSDTKNDLVKFLKAKKPKFLQVDMGSELVNEDIVKACELYGVKLSIAKKEDKQRQSIVERFNLTLRQMLGKYMQAYDTKTWYDILPDFIKNYNENLHSGIGEVPNDAYSGKVEVEPKYPSEAALKLHGQFHVNDVVRRLMNRKTFQKSGKPRWSDNTYTIYIVLPFSFVLKGENGKQLTGTYRAWELQKVDKTENIPEKRKVITTGQPKYKAAPIEKPSTRATKKVDYKKLAGKK